MIQVLFFLFFFQLAPIVEVMMTAWIVEPETSTVFEGWLTEVMCTWLASDSSSLAYRQRFSLPVWNLSNESKGFMMCDVFSGRQLVWLAPRADEFYSEQSMSLSSWEELLCHGCHIELNPSLVSHHRHLSDKPLEMSSGLQAWGVFHWISHVSGHVPLWVPLPSNSRKALIASPFRKDLGLHGPEQLASLSRVALLVVLLLL